MKNIAVGLLAVVLVIVVLLLLGWVMYNTLIGAIIAFGFCIVAVGGAAGIILHSIGAWILESRGQ